MAFLPPRPELGPAPALATVDTWREHLWMGIKPLYSLSEKKQAKLKHTNGIYRSGKPIHHANILPGELYHFYLVNLNMDTFYSWFKASGMPKGQHTRM